MTKEDKTLGKALDIALSLGSNKPTLDRCVETGIQMAAWKEQQMIEKTKCFLFEIHRACDITDENGYRIELRDLQARYENYINEK